MTTPIRQERKWTERPNVPPRVWGHNESMFEQFFDRNADAIWVLDPARGVFVDCNDAAVQLMQARDKAELLFKTPDELSPSSQPDGSRSADRATNLIELVRRQGSLEFEWVARRFDGAEIPLRVQSTAVQSHDRELHIIVSRDISTRKQVEAAARESERLLASIADNVSEALYRTSPRHELIFANRSYLRLSGYESLAEMQRVPREQLYARSTDRQRLLAKLELDGCFRNEEIEYIRRDGQHWWGLTNSVAIRDPRTGTVLYHVGSVADITERRKAAEEIKQLNASLERRIAERTQELSESEARMRTLVEHAPEAIVVFDGDTGRFLSCNGPALELYGWERSELTRLTPAEVSPEFQSDGRRSAELAREKMDEALAGGTPVFEWIHQHKSGRLIETEVRLVRLPSEGRRLLRASIADDTERRRRERIQQATYEISEAAHTTEDLAGLYARIHAIVKMLMPAENFYIALADPNGRTFNFPYLVDAHDLSTAPLPMDKGWTGYVMRTGKPLLAGTHKAVTPDGLAVLAEDGERVEAFACGARVANIWLGAPLAIRGRTIGVVVVQDYQNPRAYGEEEKRILTFVAGQIALAIERKRAEQALRESEEKFRALFESSSQGVMLHDEHQYLEVNPAAVRILGCRSPEELLGRHPRDTSPARQANGEPSDALAKQYIGECMSKGSARFDWLAQRASGEIIPLEVILTRVEWRGRQIIQAVINDNSDRHRREKIQQATFQITEAAHTARDLDGLYGQIHAIVNGLMPAGNFYIALLDPVSETFSFPYFVDERDAKPGPLKLSQGLTGYVLRTGKALLASEDNIQHTGPDGFAMVADGSGDACYLEIGAPAAVWLGVPLIAQDKRIGVMALQSYRDKHAYGEPEKQILTFVASQIAQAIERKQAQQALRESEEKFRALFESSSQGVVLHDEDRYLEVNPAAIRMLGYRSREELIGRHQRDTSPPLQANGEPTEALARRYIAECLSQGSARFDWLARRASGEIIPLEVILTRIEWRGRQIIQAVLNDISERKRAEEELLRALAREKELGQLKNNFVSMVSHEFRTPLGIIQSSTEILADYLDQLEPADRREQLDSIVRNTRRMANLMEEVLVLGRLDAGRMAFQPAALDLRVFCQRIVDEISAAGERRCPIVLACDGEDWEVQVDESLLRHIFTNLLSNAVKFSEPAAPVEFCIRRPAGEIVFLVRDRGAGIPEADLPWMFTAFHRGRNVGHIPGTGLGLTIVKRCVELHRGHIKIESQAGQGTTVTVRLPAQPASTTS